MSFASLTIDQFVKKWNEKESLLKATGDDLVRVEESLNIKLPKSYKYLITQYGDLFTPGTLEAVVDNELDLNDVQDFELPIEALESTIAWQKSGLSAGYYAFASDSMGNMFCFKVSECKNECDEPPVWFFDHDFMEIDKEAENFVSWLKSYNDL